jgi:hypothetical protein
MSDYFNLKHFLHLATNFTAFVCEFWIYPTLHFLGSWLGGVFFVQRLWKCESGSLSFSNFIRYGLTEGKQCFLR